MMDGRSLPDENSSLLNCYCITTLCEYWYTVSTISLSGKQKIIRETSASSALGNQSRGRPIMNGKSPIN